TSACALITRQSGKRGIASLSLICSVNARGSIGANNPLRARLLLMMPVTLRATSDSCCAPARNSGSAIGIGFTLPSGISTRTAALTTGGGCRVIQPPAAAPACVSMRRRLREEEGIEGAIIVYRVLVSVKIRLVEHVP